MAPPFLQTPGGAAAISAGASILDSAFGGGSQYKKNNRAMRKAYQYALRYQPGITSANARANAEVQAEYARRMAGESAHGSLSGTLEAAKEGGLHPLFALGGGSHGGGISGGSAPAFSMEGQSPGGSRMSDAVRAASDAYNSQQLYEKQKDLIDSQIKLSQARALEQVTSNDNAALVESPHLEEQVKALSPLQEFKKGEVAAHHPSSRQKGMGVKPLTNAITIGDQDIQLMVEDAADIAEDPATILVAAFFDKNNRGVQWRKAIRDYAGMEHPYDYKARNRAERAITKKFLWGTVKYRRYYKIPPMMGR